MTAKLKLTVACGDYEIVRALREGAVEADGLELIMLSEMGPRERHWRMARNAEFDICEGNVGAYFMERAPVMRIGLRFCTPATTVTTTGNTPWVTPNAIFDAAPMPKYRMNSGRIVICGMP